MDKKEISRKLRHKRILRSIRASGKRPRVVIRKTVKNIYAAVVDHKTDNALFEVSTLSQELKEFRHKANLKSAEKIGELVAKKSLERGIKELVFDRNGYPYHGQLRVIAETIRKAGVTV